MVSLSKEDVIHSLRLKRYLVNVSMTVPTDYCRLRSQPPETPKINQ
ncbi:hypothetical protein [Leptothoe spongobia]|nr:hypothetical protein [Leptothoe spongobia]